MPEIIGKDDVVADSGLYPIDRVPQPRVAGP